MITTPSETDVHQYLKPFFIEHAFIPLTEKKQFRQLTDIGFQNVILSSGLQNNEVTLCVKFGCRNDQIEQIAQQFLKTPMAAWFDANTLISSIDRFSSFPNFRINSEDQLADACQKIELFFDTQGFNFMTMACGLPTLDWLLNEHPDQPCPYVYNQTHRCYKGLIAARLNHNPHFNHLIDSYRHQLSCHTQNPYEQLSFERLIAYLQYYSPN